MKTCLLCDTAYPNHHSNCDKDGALLIESRELEPGTVIRGKYRIVRLLGRGGMGTVYLAEHILLGRVRALKFISSELSQDPKFLKRFRHEAQAAIELQHPNVVEVVDLDQAEDGSPYIAMEYVEGPDLRHILANGALPVERALAIARGVALGLGAAHAKGIVHRDVKPENILLTGGNGTPETPKLLDFGIAAMKESGTAVSRTRGLMLTPDYAAPEQWKGMAAEEQDGRVDFYALGGVLHEMLTGKTSFHSHNTEGWMYQHLQTEPEAPSRLRPELVNWIGLDVLVLRLLAKDREQRPKDAKELVGLIDAVQNVAPMVRRETVREEAGQDWNQGSGQRSRRVPVWVWVASVAVLLAGVFALWFSLHRPRQSTNPGAQATSVQPQVNQQALALYGQGRYSEASPLLDQACTSGTWEACKDLGNMYVDGNGVAKDYSRAVALYAKACDAGYAKGCANLGNMYADGKGVAEDESRAVALYTKACDAGEGLGCSNLGDRYRDGFGVARNASRAASLYSRAVALYAKSCDAIDAWSCDKLGVMYEGGIGVAKDFSRAVALYTQACDGGNAQACHNVGVMYEHGDEIAMDNQRAVAFFAKACDASSGPLCFGLNDMYQKGFTIAMDNPRAPALYAKACDTGSAPQICYFLGTMYEEGKGVATDYPRAAAFYAKACSPHGVEPAACSSLGVMYENGNGVGKDIEKAKQLLNEGCQLGNRLGCDQIKKLQ